MWGVDFLQLRLKIYRYAKDGYSQRKIASLLCISRQNVHYHIRFLVKNKYLICKNSDGYPKQYMSTDKSYNFHMESKKNERGGRNICRVHCIGYKCKIIRFPNVPLSGWKSFKNNGTVYFQKVWNTDLGKVTFRIIQGKNESKLVFWIPEKYLDKDQLNHWKDIEPRYVSTFYNEFMKRYDCELGLLSPYQKPEFAFQEDNEFLFLAHKYNIKSSNAWVDESEGSPEWETNSYTLAKAKLELPERLLRLEESVDRIIVSVERVEVSLKRMADAFSPPKKSDGDVAFG